MPTSLTRKNDFIVWLYMSGTQIQIYRDFLGLERVKEVQYVCYSNIHRRRDSATDTVASSCSNSQAKSCVSRMRSFNVAFTHKCLQTNKQFKGTDALNILFDFISTFKQNV